jgi:hypothetical protein
MEPTGDEIDSPLDTFYFSGHQVWPHNLLSRGSVSSLLTSELSAANCKPEIDRPEEFRDSVVFAVPFALVRDCHVLESSHVRS